MTVEKGAEGAGSQEEVKTDGAAASTAKETSELDLAEELVKSLEREAKLAIERDNYKEGMLKAKGKLKTDDDAADETGKTDSAASATALQPLLRRIKELETAAAHKSQISTTGQGTGSETTLKVGDNMFSDGQLQDLKARGWDDVKIARFKANLLKNRS